MYSRFASTARVKGLGSSRTERRGYRGAEGGGGPCGVIVRAKVASDGVVGRNGIMALEEG
jgi:hypothetical protein